MIELVTKDELSAVQKSIDAIYEHLGVREEYQVSTIGYKVVLVKDEKNKAPKSKP